VHKLSQWVWAAKRNLVHFRHKFAPFDCSMTNDFLCLLSVNEESFRDISLIRCPGRKKRFREHNLPAVWGEGNCSMTNDFLCLLSVNEESFRDISLIRCPVQKERFREHNLPAVWGEGNCKFFWWGGFRPKDVWNKHCLGFR